MPLQPSAPSNRPTTACSDLRSYLELPDGWDGEGSFSARPQDIAALLEALKGWDDATPPQAMLSSSGQVGLYWDTPPVYIDLEIEREFSNSDASLFIRVKVPVLDDDELFVGRLSIAEALQLAVRALSDPQSVLQEAPL